MTHTLHIDGKVPAKKNNLRVTKRGGMYGKAVARAIQSLEWQMTKNRPASPLRGVSITMLFHVSDHRSDGDGKETTLLDCLRRMGWIENDTTDCVTSVHWTAVPSEAERTEITIREGK